MQTPAKSDTVELMSLARFLNRSNLVLGLVLILSLGSLWWRYSQTTPEAFLTGRVSRVVDQETIMVEAEPRYVQELEVTLQSGQTVTTMLGSAFQPLAKSQTLSPGDQVILTQDPVAEGEAYLITDVNRLPILGLLAGLFVLAVIWVARSQGLRAVIGMVVTLSVLLQWVIPQLLAGSNPVLVCLGGSIVIGATAVYMAHGWNLKSHLALASIALTLMGVSLVSWVVIQAGTLVGLGSHEAYLVQFGPTLQLNAQGLLLGGIMLGAVGILDDIVVAQIGMVFQLKQVKKKMTFVELYQRGLAVGRDHVASLVNTLVLAYAGANLPLFLLFVSADRLPWWVSVSNEMMAEEIVRTLVGSLGLIAAVPLATGLAAWVAQRVKPAQLQASFELLPHNH